MARRLLDERGAGTMTIDGTDWPVRDQLHREQLPGRPVKWIVTLGLVKGVPRRAEEYRTRHEALAAWEGS